MSRMIFGMPGKLTITPLFGQHQNIFRKIFNQYKDSVVFITTEQIAWLSEVIRFIEFYLKRAKEFRDTSKKDIIDLLTQNNFTQPERLGSMAIWSLTKDNIEDQKKKLEAERNRLDTLNQDDANKMYRRELSELKM